MSADEVRKELKGDSFYIDGIINGREYAMGRKLRQNWRHGETTHLVLDVVKLRTPSRHNTVYLASVANYMGEVATIYHTKFFQRLTKEGKVELLMMSGNDVTVITAHTLERFLERAGLNLMGVIKKLAAVGTFLAVPYEWKGEQHIVFAVGQIGLCFLEVTEDSWWICKTFVDWGRLGEGQKDATAFSAVQAWEESGKNELDYVGRKLQRRGLSINDFKIATPTT